MRPYAKTLNEPFPDIRSSTAVPPAKTTANPGNPSQFRFDDGIASLVAKTFHNYREWTTFPGIEESYLPVSYKADEK